MVEDRVTDGKRIGQLLASELSGREDGSLGRVALADADPDAEPSPDGRLAYRVSVDEDPVARVTLYPESVTVVVTAGVDSVATRAREEGLDASVEDGRAVVRVESGAAVKRALDAIVAGLS